MSHIAVLIPCYNEERTVTKVVKDFRSELPDADIFVYDNNSRDATAQKAKKAGALVKKEIRQGKGFVVERMFRDIEADIYVLVDGDDTYPADKVHEMIGLITVGADMVVGDRMSNGTYGKENKRNFHGFGNDLVRSLVNFLFHSDLNDIMSGYRVFSRDFVKNYPVLVGGFQIETDMTIAALDRNFVIREIPISYRDRPKGSTSKLNTYSDGLRVLSIIFHLFRYYRPMFYFTTVSLTALLLGIFVGMPVILEFVQTRYIARVPSAILASGLILLSALSFFCGIILDAVRRNGREMMELHRKK